jgi:hypothetical protein
LVSFLLGTPVAFLGFWFPGLPFAAAFVLLKHETQIEKIGI